MVKRWKMHKLGFLNFWLYDREEFLLEDGHILLRGNNGSGKSITTQSFIPFLLDGNRSPERLDPFGTRDRKMDYYLLGDNDREESTGYLYLEFKKQDVEEYLTIGIGLRAQRGKNMDFWGFCLGDGRRIGPDGVQLYETLGGQLLPLTKQKLRNLINDSGSWAESPGAYKQMVNERVFQFRDIRQYDQLIQLLIKVRTPKLSKEAFRPSEVKKVLNESLQVLTDEDLSAMVSTMERMDALEDTLRDYRAAMQDAVTIRNEYNRYNQYILGMKGQAYFNAHGDTLRLNKQLQEEQETLKHLEEELEQNHRLLEESQARLAQARTQRAAMGEDDLSSKRTQLEHEQELYRQHRQQLEQGEEQLQRQRDQISRLETRLRQQLQELEDTRLARDTGLDELEALNHLLDMGEEHQQYLATGRTCAGGEETLRQALRSALQRRRKQISDTLACLEELERTRAEYDAACQALDQASTAEYQARGTLRDAEQQERRERDRLLEQLARWLDGTQELKLGPEDQSALKRMVSLYQVPADWTPIRDLLDARFQSFWSAVQELRVRADNECSRLKREADLARQELKTLRAQPDPVPDRRGQIQATRIQLVMRGIPHAALYEVVDFAPDLAAADRDLLEAQLSDSGLLDALVVPEENRSDIQDLLQEYPDRFLLPGAPVPDPIQALVPDGGEQLRAAVLSCLQSISRSDAGAETALLPDGRFRCGMIRGCSQAEQPAGFVGAAARRANHQRQVAEKEAQVEQLLARLAACQTEAEQYSARLDLLREERDNLPLAGDLDQALSMLEQARRALALAEEERNLRMEKERGAKQAMMRVEQQSRELSYGLPYERTIQAFEEAQDAAEQYQDRLSDLAEVSNKLKYAAQSAEETRNTADELRDQADAQRKMNQQRSAMAELALAGIREIETFLNLPENQARARRLAELEEEINRQQAAKELAGTTCSRLEERRSNTCSILRQRQQALDAALAVEEDLERYFAEDLDLGFHTVGNRESMVQCAQEAYARVPAADRDRSPERLGDALRNNYQQHNNTLLKYHPKIELIFDDPSQPGMLRQRLSITLQVESRELSIYDFIRELQSDIDMTSTVLEEKDRELFENILTETVSHTLRLRIEESQQWTRNMTALMAALDTSMGLTFRLDWKPKRAEGDAELDTAQLVTLLNKDRGLVTAEDSLKVSSHFRTKVRKAREEASLQDQAVNYADLIRQVLDYRNWYEFILFFEKVGEPRRELTDRAFNKFSGGEKAMAMYVPLFAAVSAQYKKASEAAPRMLALDEAFAGVDERNISSMFELVRTMDFDYIMNSQALWGCYSTVDNLDIAELHRPSNASVVTILRYHWNGGLRVAVEEES